MKKKNNQRRMIALCFALAALLLLMGGCTAKKTAHNIYDVQIQVPQKWDAASDMEHRVELTCQENRDVHVLLICHSNTSLIDMTGEEYVSQPGLDIIHHHVESFSTGREKVEIEKSEILRGKASPMVHVKLSFEAEGKRYVHDRYVFVYKNRQYSLSGSWPADAEASQIKAAQAAIDSLVMK